MKARTQLWGNPGPERVRSCRKDLCRRECGGDQKVAADGQAAPNGASVLVVGNTAPGSADVAGGAPG